MRQETEDRLRRLESRYYPRLAPMADEDAARITGEARLILRSWPEGADPEVRALVAELAGPPDDWDEAPPEPEPTAPTGAEALVR